MFAPILSVMRELTLLPSPPAVLLLVLAAAVLSTPPPARACRCQLPDRGFVVPAGNELPANAFGLAWEGSPRRAEDFEIVEVTSEGEVPQVAKTRAAGAMAGLKRHQTGWNVRVVGVEGGLRPGARYRFRSRPEGGVVGSGERSEAEFTVAEAELVLPKQAVLALGPLEHAPTVIAAGGSCSRKAETARRGVIMELPGVSEAAKQALFYLTLVDGRGWTPTSSICKRPDLGRSWKGIAEDLVFQMCPESRHHGVKAGARTIQMVALLPGTEVVLRSEEVSVDFACQTP